MKLSLITPCEFIEDIGILPGRFCIASVAHKNEKYRNYFKKAAEAGYEVIMDSGTFEEQELGEQDYLNLVNEIKPKVLIAPDTINCGEIEAWQRAEEFAEQMEIAYKPEIMFVPQLGHPVLDKGKEHILTDLVQRVMQEDKFFKWVGICRDACFQQYNWMTHSRDQEINRLAFVWDLTKRFGVQGIAYWLKAGKRFHFLGVGDNVHLIKHYWFVESMDTASFWWQAYCGQNMSYDGILKSKFKRPHDYFTRSYAVNGLSNMQAERDGWRGMRENCLKALKYAEMADELKHILIGDRL